MGNSYQNKNKIRFKDIFRIGFLAIIGSFTPVQLGVEALRALHLKNFGINIKDSIAASMLVKGLKFAIVLILAVFFLPNLLNSSYVLLISAGFLVIFLATLLFLIPIIPSLGIRLSLIFLKLSKFKFLKFFETLHKYFLYYTNYLKELNPVFFLYIIFLAAFSWIFELFSLIFAFMSINLSLSLGIMVYASALINILERIPFLPRGIGLLELVCFYYFKSFHLQTSLIGAALVIFTFSRLIFPALISVMFSLFQE